MDHRGDGTSTELVRRKLRRSRRSRMIKHVSPPQLIPADHREGVLEGLAEVERGEFAGKAELEAFFRRYNP